MTASPSASRCSEVGVTRRALITGIAGSLAALVGRRLHEDGYEIIGVDYRKPRLLDYPAQLYQANYNKTKIEDIFRRHPPSHVFHLGRVGNLKERLGKRFDLNVIGSRKVMDLSVRVGARRLVVLSTFHIYGADAQNHIPIYEDEPLRAGSEFPQIADAIQLDNQALTWAYRHTELKTAVLRPTNVVGPAITNTMSQFLRLKRVPVLMGFDPMTQFIHQDDLAAALELMGKSEHVGVFNVAGPRPIPWRRALSVAGMSTVPVPTSVAIGYLRLAGTVSRAFPPYLLRFFQYPCVISDRKIREALHWTPTVDPEDAIRQTAQSLPS